MVAPATNKSAGLFSSRVTQPRLVRIESCVRVHVALKASVLYSTDSAYMHANLGNPPNPALFVYVNNRVDGRGSLLLVLLLLQVNLS